MLDGQKGDIVIHRVSSDSAAALAALDVHISPDSWNEALFAKEFEHAFSNIFGAYLAIPQTGGLRKLCAFAVVHLVLDEAHLVRYGVHDAFRQRGIGRLLLKHIEKELAGCGTRQLHLEVRSGNFAAQQLYASQGFRQVGLRKAYYSDSGEDALLLRKTFHEEVKEIMQICEKK